ncbi:prolyl-tRNA synthetase [Paenibacillus shirakamiensis]|uniref:Proline--tRNA ligase n=1 Tax=Paenibacillus shirakamiensis TaxID=1265935 RepID=A0ABS4JFL9_9BACL|nr:proline--tRNA ligase [Paenibacillus shirakamiensis]MBP2000510.1 prolyl-tRNA synthetase [Paenibacillus shirakamiensis]
MKQSKLFIPTLREAPSEAEAISHQILIRGGYIRPLASGIYTYLPLGKRVLQNIETIIRQEMNKSGAQEITMPAMQPAELWHASGRYERYGPELIRLQDRHGREFALGPTHEEVVTTLVRDEINSYRQLPLSLYQIQTKYRDERRPRFGLLRGREFLMKDAYSFDKDGDGLHLSYRAMYEAYTNVFTRTGLNFRAVQADAGAIGGEGETHEFMALADIGEDTLAVCTACDYAANLEKAEYRAVESTSSLANRGLYSENNQLSPSPIVVSTPGVHTIDELVDYMNVEASSFIKTLIYLCDQQPVAVLIRGDHEVNEIKLKHKVGAEQVELADASTVSQVTQAPVGFAGPIGLTIPILVDADVSVMTAGITGANQVDTHLTGVRPGIDFAFHHVASLRNASVGDHCPICNHTLEFIRGIEVGHVFKLGNKYSKTLGAVFTDAQGKSQEMVMGCYGIGVSRIMSAVAEQYQHESGIVWPTELAPFRVHIIPISVKDTHQMALATALYNRLLDSGVEVLLDDREERVGVKFKDADLIGSPIRIIAGQLADQGQFEWKIPGTKDREIIDFDTAFHRIIS